MVDTIFAHMKDVWEEYCAELGISLEYSIICTNQGSIIFFNQKESICYECSTNEIELMQYLADNNLQVHCMQEDYWKCLQPTYEEIPVEFDCTSWRINIPMVDCSSDEEDYEMCIDDRVDAYEDLYYFGD